MDPAAIVLVVIVAAIVVIWVVFLLRDRLLELSVNGKEAKMEVRAKPPESTADEKPVSVVFKGNKLRGEGEYRMRSSDFSDNDVDGKQKLELGYDEPTADTSGEDN
jgi:hypothetical protein